MEVTSADPLSWRERKKLQTRDALSWAVIRLSVERGWGNVTVEDAAAAASVSERTFRNYFTSKAEAVAARHRDRMLHIAAELRSHPPGEPLWDAITSAVATQFAGGQPQGRSWNDAIQLMLTEPDVAGEFLKANAAAQRDLAVAIAERTGTDPAHDLYPTLVAAAITAATTTAMDHWLRADPPVALEDLVREAFSQLRAGLPVP
ncbi:MAG TPA: TetR family transcriptional regulator [Streptosporangiaceae bacterium]|nr:TetR family transcriptional regulator [Streptosporangiaceae bacterium]